MALLPTRVREGVQDIIAKGLMKEGELDSFEVQALSTFSEDIGDTS